MMNRSTKLVLLALVASAAISTLAATHAHAQRGIFIDRNGVTIRDRYGNVKAKTWGRILNPLTNVRRNEQPIYSNGVVVGTKWIGLDGKLHYDYTKPGPNGTTVSVSKFAPSQYPSMNPLPQKSTNYRDPFPVVRPGVGNPRYGVGGSPLLQTPKTSPRTYGPESFHKSFGQPF